MSPDKRKRDRKTGRFVKRRPAARKQPRDETPVLQESSGGEEARSVNGTPGSEPVKARPVQAREAATKPSAPESEEQRILAERTERLAREGTARDQRVMQEGFDHYVRFRLGEVERYGIPSRYVKEVMPPKGMAEVPGAPTTIAGIISRSGELLTVVNLKAFFQTRGKDYDPEALIIVVRGAGMTLGILVDDVEDYVRFWPSRLAPPLPSEGVRNPKHVQGIDQESDVSLLNMEVLLADPDLSVRRH